MNNKKNYKIFFVGGGTGGHMFPNLAVIEELKKNTSRKKNIETEIFYVGTRNWVDSGIISQVYKIKYFGIYSGKLRRYSSFKNFTDIFLILLGFIQSFFILLFNRPKIIFAKGGFVTVPFCLAATVLRIPFVVHESDTVLGLSNKILLPFAKKVYLGFPVDVCGKKIPAKKSQFTGNPIRSSIFDSISKKEIFCKSNKIKENRKIILVMGGSQGAQAINKAIINIIPNLVKKYTVFHITGKTPSIYFKKDPDSLEEKYKDNYRVFGSINQDKIGNFIANADLIISRAGANSIAEMIALKKIAILIPLPLAASDHQRKNATFLKEKGIFRVIEEKEITNQKILNEIDFLISNKKEREKMVKNMENIFPENSAQIIAEDLLKFLGD